MGEKTETQSEPVVPEAQGKENRNPKDILSLEVLAVVKQSQSQHGLKHSDYQRYRQYCTKRIRRIRKALAYVQSVGTKNRATYHARPVTTQVLEEKKSARDALRLLYIPLIMAERCWAYAMQLKQEANTEPRKKFHMIRRFRKAMFYAGKLRELCNDEHSRCDARTKLEACAYADYLHGLYFFETEQWQKASDLLKNAQTIYEQLYSVINDEEILGHYKQRVEEIKPTLRYCAFNIGEKGVKTKEPKKGITGEVIKIDQLISETRGEKSEAASDFEWLGKPIFVKHEKIRTFLQEVKNPNQEWQFSLYEQMIFDCRDCLQLLRDTNSDKSALYQYLTYIRLDLIIKRNLLLIGTLQNASDLLRQYEIIIGCYNEIKSLQLSQYFTDDFLVEKFHAELDAQIMVYKAYRCYYIGHVAIQNWKESIALLDRSVCYCKQALQNEHLTQENRAQLHHLLSKADVEKFAIYAENISKDENEPSSSVVTDDKEPLINRLDSYVNDQEIINGNVPLVPFPPEYRAIPAKPLFFDLALNHIKFPPLDEEINANKGGQSGLTGMVKGWLGGWRK